MLCVNVILIYYMVFLNISYLVIKVNVFGYFNIIVVNFNKKIVSDNMCKDKLLKSKVI